MTFKRTLTLLLVFTILLLSGCGERQIKTSTEPKQQDAGKQAEKVKTPELEPKKYDTPFIYFEYPSDFEETTPIDIGVNNYSEQTKVSIVSVDNYQTIVDDIQTAVTPQNIMQIHIAKILNPDVENSNQIRDFHMSMYENRDVKVLDDKSFLNDNIAIYDIKVYEEGAARFRNYFYTNGNGKCYIAIIAISNPDSSNRDYTQKVIDIFDKSLKFK